MAGGGRFVLGSRLWGIGDVVGAQTVSLSTQHQVLR